MVTMIDQMFDRHYQSARADLNSALDLMFRHIGHAAGNAFRVLNRIEYNAPWLERRRKAKRA
jgi:hypothetical protein